MIFVKKRSGPSLSNISFFLYTFVVFLINICLVIPLPPAFKVTPVTVLCASVGTGEGEGYYYCLACCWAATIYGVKTLPWEAISAAFRIYCCAFGSWISIFMRISLVSNYSESTDVISKANNVYAHSVGTPLSTKCPNSCASGDTTGTCSAFSSTTSESPSC